MRVSFDESGMETLTTIGPTEGPLALNARSRAKTSKIHQTVAWSEHGSEGRRGDGDGSAQDPTTQRTDKSRKNRKPIHKLSLVIVICQALWAWVIPLKNIATVTFPTTLPDSVKTHALSYLANDTENGIVFSVDLPVIVPGTEILPLLKQVLGIVIGNDIVRDQLLKVGTFDVEAIYKLLSVDEFATMAKYYAVVFQSTEFPGGRFTTRTFAGQTNLTVVFRSSSQAVDDASYELLCSPENAFLKATRCTRDVDGYPCDADDSVARTFSDVKLAALTNNTGLDNNVALLYVVDYFHQAVSTLFAAKDWSSALEDLNYNQSTEYALEAGTASVYTKDGFPYLLEGDAFLVGIQAALMDTVLPLDSCVAAEIVVGQFYVRTLVLHTMQMALATNGVLGGASQKIAVPSTLPAVLGPLWQYNISLTSGARALPTHETFTHFFREKVASVKTVAAQFKFDRKETTVMPGSSVRLLQYMVYYTDIVSKFEHALSGSGQSYTQTYKLLGWVGSDFTTFRDSYAASSLMVVNLVELSKPAEPTNKWWDDEKRYAAYFQALEASAAAPFKIFDTSLSIASATRAVPADDHVTTRCQRALFKVVGKLSYLALLELSIPANYLMFMGEVPIGAKTWLLNKIFSDELAAETASGERIGFAYRNGPYTRKDDGSAWVTVPLLDAMIKYFGKDAAASALLQEIDSSFKLFLKESNGKINFPDTALCRVSGAMGTPQAVVASDSLDRIYDKILPGLQSAVLDLLDQIPDLAAKFKTAMTSQGIPWVTLTEDQILGSPVITRSTDGHGPPTTTWQPSAITAGLRKLWPPKTPTDESIKSLRATTVCYKMLDVRDFTTTTRCFAEPSNTAIVRTQYRSESMRKFFQLMWSMAVMLNTIVFVVVLKYIRKLYKAWLVTKYECLHVEVALQLNLQGMGVLNISMTLLLLVASLPALVTFHIPNDAVFLPYFLSDEKLPKATIDFFVTLSMSWFLKLGFDVCNTWILPKRPVEWYHLFRVRLCMLLLIFIARLISPEKINHGSYLLAKLLVTCFGSIFLGMLCSLVVFLPERPGKVVDIDSKDAVVAALVKQNMPLTRYGVLGRTSKGWSTTALLVEGWRLARTADGDEVLRKDGGEILLPKQISDDDGEQAGEFVNAASGDDTVAAVVEATDDIKRKSKTEVTL
jgi:hypothetical protein